jgi:hypothetical protein
MTWSSGLAGRVGLQGRTGVRQRESIFRAPSLGQGCLYGIQLFAGHLQLEPEQCCISAIAGFLRQRARNHESLLSFPGPSHPMAWLGDGRFCQMIPGRLVALSGLSGLPMVTANLS